MRHTHVVVDLGAIRHNLEVIRAHTGGKIMMAIKADAYGHGAAVVGRFVQDKALVDMLGVTSIEEGLDLREAGVRLPILIFSLIDRSREDIDAVFRYDLMPTVVDDFLTQALTEGARRWQRPVAVHVKTDTGMGRLGLAPHETLAVLHALCGNDAITIAGLYTHFPVADTGESTFTASQIQRFTELASRAAREGIACGLRHCANSGAILSSPAAFMERYGVWRGPYEEGTLFFYLDEYAKESPKDLLSVPGKPMAAFICPGHPLLDATPRDTTLATLPIGYADGYTRILSNRSKILIRGKTYPVVGRICMDQCLIDLGDDTYAVGEEVELFGSGPVTAADVAAWGETIPYEVTCNMSRRVPRTYSGGSFPPEAIEGT